ncbi:MAG: hypothetical protein COA85_02670 [Robiginitomaculum sp.]|nr:MAG: hypothetical protein COA85_02670 [Robiginitomaculum sp.]
MLVQAGIVGVFNSQMAIIAIPVAGGVIGALYQSWRVVVNYKSEVMRKMKEYTLEYSLTKDTAHIDARTHLAHIFEPATRSARRLSLEQINEKIDNDSSVQSKIRLLFNHWENMSLAIHHKIAHEETAFEMVSARLVNTVYQYGAYIENVQSTNPRSYRHLVRLAKSWNKRVGKHKPLFKSHI